MSLLHRTHDRHDDLPELTPQQLAELDALDAALLGEDIADDALATLVRDVRAAAPELGTEGTQQLNDRLGIALDPARRRLPLSPRRLMYGPGGVAASLLVVLAVGGGSAMVLSDRGRFATDDSAVSERPTAAVEEFANPKDPTSPTEQSNVYRRPSATSGGDAGAASSADAATEDAAPSSRLQGLSANSNRSPGTSPDLGLTVQSSAQTLTDTNRSGGRAVERAIDLAVRVKNGELPDASRKVSQITRDANGYVASSDMNLGTAGAGSASFALRVDSSKLDRAVDRLSGLGTVTSQNESSQDITSTLDSANQQLSDARKTRESLLKALGKATDSTEISKLRAQIAANRSQLARLDAQVQRVERRADLTTIQLSLAAPSKGDPAADDGSWSLGDAAGDAWSALRAILGGLLVVAAVVAPFALLGGAGYAIWRRRRRAARERTLDA